MPNRGAKRAPLLRVRPILAGLAFLAAGLLAGCSLPVLPAVPTALATPAPPLVVASAPPTLAAAATPAPPPALPATGTPLPPAPTRTPRPVSPAGGLPVPDHVVVVLEENHRYGEVIGAPAAPYIGALARQGALFTDSHAVTHPSEPNYLALFSGSTQGVGDDSCPHQFATPNLGSALRAAGRSFAGYSEDLPAPGATVCTAGAYARKHNPWVNFANLPAAVNRPFADFPADYSTLPTVAFVIPNLANDMHDGSVAQGDTWLQAHLDGYARWAVTHNSLLIIQWDEDDNGSANQIPTIFAGPMVRPGTYGEPIDHYTVLRTVADFYGLPPLGQSADVAPITDVWQPVGSP